MAEPTEKKRNVIDLHKTSAEDFVRFLDHKTPGEDLCPVCKKDNWSVVCPGGDDSAMYRLGIVVRNVPKPFYLATFAYFCDNCGYLRQHISKLVHEWVQENPAGEEFDSDDATLNDNQESAPDE